MPVLLRGCQKPATKPSPIVAAFCLAIAAAHDRHWIAGPVSSLIPPELSPARLSRLKARILPVLEAEVAGATRRGRPPLPVADHVSSATALEALLEVAAWVISEIPIRGRVLQDRLVEAAERLRREHRISLQAFASKLGISARTLRYWRRRRRPAPKAPEDLPEQAPSAKDEPAEATAGEPPTGAEPPAFSNDGCFSLEIQPPGLQAMADTTDIRAFGTTLKLVGAQDTGNRHRRLLESFRVSQAESAQLVIEVISGAFAEPAGTQVIVDQGTPYMAEETKKALEKLEVEHCPQKEATPTEKAPLERAWRTIKDALEPLLGLTNRLAERIPALQNTTLARAATELLVGTFLRVYASARAPFPHPLDARDPLALVSVVEDAKERARAEHRSRKLLLEDIHARYAMAGSAAAFVRAHRRAALEDIQEAERRLRDRACRCRTRACDRYFAGILSKVSEEGRRRRAIERRHAQEMRRLSAEERRLKEHEQALEADPEKRLHEGLSMLASQSRGGSLLFGGKGLGRAFVERAVVSFLDRGPLFWKDEIRAAWHRWVASTRGIPTASLIPINELLEEMIANLERRSPPPLPVNTVEAILKPKARTRTGPPPLPPHLRI